MSDIIETIKRVLVKPESTVEKVAHEVVEFFAYGSLFHVIASKLASFDLDDSGGES